MTLNAARVVYETALIDGKKTSYVKQGQGQPVVLVHGFAASLHDWDDMLPDLDGAGFTSYALDLLGHGESEKPLNPADYSVESMYAHLAAWIDHLHFDKPITIIGHSLGAGLSMLYAQRNPAHVKALVLISPFHTFYQLPAIWRRVLVRYPWLTHSLLERTPYGLLRLFVDVSSLASYIGQREAHLLPEHVRYQTALDYKRASSGIYNVPHTLSSIELKVNELLQPALLLWGDRDQTLDPGSFPILAERLPNLVEAQRFPECGHVPHQCHPENFNPHVLDFLCQYA